MTHRRCVFLDRDGTIIVEKNYLSEPQQVELLPNAAAGMRKMQAMGLGLIVVTNQSGIARGYFTEQQLAAVHNRLSALLEAEGIVVDGIYVCPHGPADNCNCRKPRTGLVEQAARKLRFVSADCFVIGDKPSDIDLGRNLGATTVFIRADDASHARLPGLCEPDFIADDLMTAARRIEQVLLMPHLD
ncbi:MAG: HAD family hydrolase [Planctomycetaceae bacterium]|nr:HAD family hydrolase [Planctomycetaceae bacterium]